MYSILGVAALEGQEQRDLLRMLGGEVPGRSGSIQSAADLYHLTKVQPTVQPWGAWQRPGYRKRSWQLGSTKKRKVG